MGEKQMKKYLAVKTEVIEKIWKIEAKSYNEAVDGLKVIIQNDKDLVEGFPSDMFNETVEWKVFGETDMVPGRKKFVMREVEEKAEKKDKVTFP